MEPYSSDIIKRRKRRNNDLESIIAARALYLVKVALLLTEKHYYDDAIEILYQVIDIYNQINKIDEIETLCQKILEIYKLKKKK